ncbi:uncharacterized protein MEPE_04972 [Melanopsichium pennsylvanicum]|uniref:Dynactin 2 n=1 Tax=Melanopsichium pennsylvanicum TaxID=63383 RepID=A0AAJ5C775_9BASI|nr:uncharacterized protein MEPE_04972 [Melanopsichium pennsylvanicum]
MSHPPAVADLNAAASSSYTKYASLPDVDVSAPDVYEYDASTRPSEMRSSRQLSRKQQGLADDEVTSDSSSDDSDRSANRKHAGGDGKVNQDIDSSSLRRNDAASRFSGATDLNDEQVDFSGRLKTRKSRKAGRPRDAGLETSTYAIGAGEDRGNESPVEKLRRLRFEASQLEEELNASNATLNGESAAKEGDEVDSAEVLAQLKLLQEQLGKLPLSSVPASFSASNMEKDAIRSLLQQVKPSVAPSTSLSVTAAAAAAAATATATASASASVSVSGHSTAESHKADVVQLEARLSELECTLGIQEALLDESKPVPRPVLPSLSRLEHQISLLSQPRHLDAISRRVKVLVTEMDRVHDVRRKLTTDPSSFVDPTSSSSSSTTSPSSTLTSAEVSKLQSMFEVSTRLEPLLPLLPKVVNRLQSLADLHASAAYFGSALDDLEDGKEARLQQEQELEELLRKMEMNMEETRIKVEQNFESLLGRVENLSGRLDKLTR